MSIFLTKKCEYALQAVLYLAVQGDKAVVPAEVIARELKIPKEFVSKILQSLTDSGIILSKKGKTGGFSLGKNPNALALMDIVRAVDGTEIFTVCALGFPECSSKFPCPIHEKWTAMRTQLAEMLSEQTLKTMIPGTKKKLAHL